MTECQHCGGSGAVDSGGFQPWGEPINVPCPHCEKQTLADRLREYASLDKHNRYLAEALREAADELDRRKEIIRYWSYCTDRGMLRECPEKVNELADALMSVGVAPYSIRR